MMKSDKTKIVSIIALAILMASSMIIVGSQFVGAQLVDRGEYVTFAYISANPSPIGVNQPALITFRIDQPLAGATVRSGLANGTSVTITRPDNTTEVKEDLKMDSTSSGWFIYTPTMVGTYYFQMHFPQQGPYESTTSGGGFGLPAGIYTYLASESKNIPLEVQQDPIEPYDRSPPLPTGYWTRPINAENKGWWQVSDNWLMIGYDQTSRSFAGNPTFSPYTSGPMSAHVLWKKPIISGGIVGGALGDRVYYHGISYEQYFDAMVLQGTIFYGEHGQTGSTSLGSRFLDLYTGEDLELMTSFAQDNGITFNFAQVLEIDTPNEHGALAYLWNTAGSTWEMYDFIPGRPPSLRVTLTGMSGLTGYTCFGPNGELLSFNFGGNSTHKYLYMFNSTRAILGLRYQGIDVWSPSGTINASRALDEGPNGVLSSDLEHAMDASNSPYMGIEWNVTVPDIPGVNQNERLVNVEEGLLLATQRDASTFPNVYTDVGYDIGHIAKDSTGMYPNMITHLYAINRTQIHDIHDRVSENLRYETYVRYDEGEEVWYGYNARTGALKWQTEPLGNAWALFTRIYQIAYNKLITSGFDGVVRAWNIDTGVLEWEFDKGSAGFENAYGGYPEYAGLTVADHTVYTTADEHSSDAVMWRGAQLWAINVDTGELRFKVNGMYRHPIVVDGMLVALNSYDGQVYCFGKGQSATSVSAPQVAVPLGTAITVTGSVTDQTPASKGTPAISDEDMSEWMEYLHMQKVKPVDASGVPVALVAINCATGDVIDIGTTTSDMYGKFGFAWTPNSEGTYQIIADFAGSNSYGGSTDSTYVTVGPAQPTASPTAPPTATAQPTATAPPTTIPPTATTPPTASPPGEPVSSDIYIIAGVAVVIIVVAAVAAVFLRRRK